jgi:pilus assembly protein Flp/PilA
MYRNSKNCLMMIPKREKGQSLAEYGLLLALVTVVCLTALQLLGGNLSNLMNNMSSQIVGVMGG